MIQLQILAGKEAGTSLPVKTFPCTVGRGSANTIRVEDAGVWEQHVEITFDRGVGFSVSHNPAATLLLNGEPVDSAPLRNGDLLQMGAAQIRFWLAPTRQKSLLPREAIVWAVIGALFAVQVALIVYLLQ